MVCGPFLEVIAPGSLTTLTTFFTMRRRDIGTLWVEASTLTDQNSIQVKGQLEGNSKSCVLMIYFYISLF